MMPDSTPFVIAVDGGQSRTQTLLATIEGEIIASAVTDAVSNERNAHGYEQVRRTLHRGFKQVLEKANCASSDLQHVYLGLSGLDGKLDYSTVYNTAAISFSNDAITAFAGAFPEQGQGIIVIAGTGAAIYGQLADGTSALASGMGHYLGDEGGATWIAQRGFRAVYQANDGRAPATLLTEMVLSHFDCNDLIELLDNVYGGVYSRSDLAKVSQIVSTAATQHDAVAIEILRDAGIELGRAIVAVLERLDFGDTPPPVAPIGGVFNAGEFVTAPMMHFVQQSFPLTILQHPRFSPAIGATILALRKSGISVSSSLFDKLTKSQHIVQIKDKSI